jgi:hypothetical protein
VEITKSTRFTKKNWINIFALTDKNELFDKANLPDEPRKLTRRDWLVRNLGRKAQGERDAKEFRLDVFVANSLPRSFAVSHTAPGLSEQRRG